MHVHLQVGKSSNSSDEAGSDLGQLVDTVKGIVKNSDVVEVFESQVAKLLDIPWSLHCHFLRSTLHGCNLMLEHHVSLVGFT